VITGGSVITGAGLGLAVPSGIKAIVGEGAITRVGVGATITVAVGLSSISGVAVASSVVPGVPEGLALLTGVTVGPAVAVAGVLEGFTHTVAGLSDG
jgi:hypothetical protein